MLYKRGKIWWFKIQFRGSLIRESAGTSSKTLAKRIELERRRALEEGAGNVRRKKPQLFRAAAEQWLAVKKTTLAPKSLRIEETNLSHLLPVLGGMLASDIEASDIASYQEKRRKEGAASGTMNLEMGTLRAILRRLGLWARLQPEVKIPPKRQDAGKALSAEEESRLLLSCAQSMSRALYPGVLVSLNTGLRRGELLALRWKQVDLGKRRLVVGSSKTEAGSGRAIPLNDRATAGLTIQADRFPGRKPDDFVFPTERYRMLPGGRREFYGTDPRRPLDSLTQGWEAARRRTKDEERDLPPVSCRWHDLRHTFLTRLIEAGTPFPRLAVIMGWSPATTARMAKRYGHVSTDALREDLAALDRLEIGGEGAQKGHSRLRKRRSPFRN